MTGKKIPPSQTLTLMGLICSLWAWLAQKGEKESNISSSCGYLLSLFLPTSLCLLIKTLVGRASAVLR